ncbi:MAG: hypothetical protein V3V08_23270 [Nannocystaceae bacterium]
MAIVDKGYVDTNFTDADSPRVESVRDDLAATGIFDKVTLIAYCDGPGDIVVEFAERLVAGNPVYATQAGVLKEGEQVKLERVTVTHMRITHTGVDSAYRIVIYV